MKQNTIPQRHNNFIIISLMITIVIDIMGLGMVFPIIPQLVLGHDSILLSSNASHVWQIVAYGLAMASWPLGIFIGGPFLGQVSDRISRRKTLIICLFATSIIYALTGFSILWHSFIAFIILRFCSGYVGGAFEIAQASVADISPEKQKARNLGWIVAAASLGFIVGPMITGFSTLHESISVGIVLPFFIAAVISLVNMGSIALLYRDTYTKRAGVKIHLWDAITECRFIFVDKRIRFLGWCLFLLQVGWGFYVMGMPLVLDHTYHFSTSMIGFFFTLMGVATFVAVMIAQPLLFKRMKLWQVIALCGVLEGIVFAVGIVFGAVMIQWGVMFFAALLNLLIYSALMALLSNAVTADEQGRVMGGAGAVFGLAWFVNAILISVLSNVNTMLPIICSAVALLLCGLLMWCHQLRQRNGA